MPKTYKIHAFYAGTHTDKNGRILTYTESDIKKIADTYNNFTQWTAPVVVGHPVTNSPAHGRILELVAENDNLYCNVQFTEDMENAYLNGNYPHVSLSIGNDQLVRHLGFLGATPPALKGLDTSIVQLYSNDDKETVFVIPNATNFSNFSGSNMDKLKLLLDWIQSTFNPETRAQIEAKINELGINAQPPAPAPAPPMQAPAPAPAFSESPEYKAILAENARLQAEQNNTAFELLFAEALNGGKVTPAQKELFRTLYNQKDAMSYSENGKELKGKEFFNHLIEQFGQKVDFSEARFNKSNANNSNREALIKQVESFNKKTYGGK